MGRMTKLAPARYRVTNWPAYNAALRRRGSLLIWVDREMAWLAPHEGRPGRPPVFSDAAIQFCLSIKVLFKLSLRRAAGMVASLLRLAGLDWSVPDHSTLCRRQKTVTVQIPYRRADGPLNLLVDSTGIKFLGDGEWQARKHGSQRRRRWRKVHLAMDTVTSDIRAVEFTPSRDGDSPVLPGLLDQLPEDEEIGNRDRRRGLRHPPLPRRHHRGATPSRSSRSAGTAGRGRRTVRPPSRATRPCAPPATTGARSGSAGPATTPAAGSRPRCGASKPSASASPQETPTARPPKSTSASPS